MDFKIQGKKALITGAGRGLGASIVEHLVAEGVHVAIVSRGKAALKELFASIGGAKAGHIMMAEDMTAEGVPVKVCKEIQKKFGSPDIIVNNLGDTLDIRDPYCTIDDWRRVFRINLEVGIEINNFFIPAMQKNQWGRIVHITSIAALENQGRPRIRHATRSSRTVESLR